MCYIRICNGFKVESSEQCRCLRVARKQAGSPRPQNLRPTNLSPAQQPSIARPQHLLALKYGALPKMLSCSSISRGAQRAFRRQCAQPVQRRGLAAPASGSFQYQTDNAKGVKFASRDLSGPTTTLALVSRAGTRYQLLPGLTEGLEKFAFRVWEPLQHKIPFVEAVLTYECLIGN